MKISLQWLADFLTPVPDAQRAADALTNSGLLVEHIAAVGNDHVLDVEVPSNRGDCLSHRGIARELAAALDLKFDPRLPGSTFRGQPGPPACPVSIEALDLCPHYLGQVVRGVRVAPSPPWLVERLTAVGVRAINNVVDATNFVMFELGQPLHAFDLAKLAGPKIIVRRARPNEKLVSLDGHERALTADMLVIADAVKPAALAGVMGGQHSEVSAATTDILLESARFDPLSIRKTARALGMKSESSYRFERGIDPALPAFAAKRAAALIAELSGPTAQPAAAPAGAGSPADSPRRLTLRTSQLRRITGIDYDTAESAAALSRLGFAPTPSRDEISVTVPTARLDVTAEIDLVEEVARMLGFDRIPTHDRIAIRASRGHVQAAMDEIRRTLAAAGFFESVTVSFITDSLVDSFADRRMLPRTDAAVRKADAYLRPSLLPGLLEALARNHAVGYLTAWLYEIGSTFRFDPAGKIVESRQVGLIAEDLPSVRAAVDALLNRLDATRSVRALPIPATLGFADGVCANVLWNDHPIGRIGLISPNVCRLLDLRGSAAPAGAELDLEPLLDGIRLVPTLRPLPRFPAIERDLSLVLKDSVTYAQLESLVRELNLPDLESIRFVTTYRGKSLAPGAKSLTIALVFRSPHGTLKGESVDAAVKSVVTAATDRLQAALRT